MGALSFMGYIQGEGRQQSSLFPPTLEELVPEDHLVRVIEAYVARLDLQALGFSKAEPLKTGRPGYDPADLLKLYHTVTSSASAPPGAWKPSANAMSR
jgi:transposase